MDIQGLKDKILQLAIQGKLVAQDPNDEPASVLLERIKEEREMLIKEGKIKKQKPLPEITEEEKPFEIHEGWEWVRLGEIIDLISGRDLPVADCNEEGIGIPYIMGASNIKNGNLLIERWIDKPQVIAQRDDLIITVKGTVGKIILLKEYEEVNLSRQVMGIRQIYNDYPYYLYYFVKSHLSKIIDKSQGVIPGISRDDILGIVFPLPPLAEQKRIVEKVDELFALIDELDSNKEELLEVINLTRNQVLQLAIQGKLVAQDPNDEPASVLLERIKEEREMLIKEGKIKKQKPLPEITEEEKPFEIPESWEWVRLEEVSSQISSKPYQIKQSDVSKDGLFPVVSQSINLIEGYSNERDKLLEIDNPVIVFGDHTRHVKYIDFNFIVGADGIKIINPIGIYGEYLYLAILYNSLCIDDRGYSRHYKYLNERLVPIPPLAEQKRIVEKVDTIMNMLDELEKTIM